MMAYIWLILLVGFLVVEVSCPIHLVSVWFAAGSLAALIAGLLGGEIWLQVVLFLVVSAGLLAAFWPIARKCLNPKVEKTNIDAVVGTLGRVAEDIDNVSAVGVVKLGAMLWSARSTNGAPIPQGALVRVDRIEGVKVFVSPAGSPVNK